MKPLYHMAFREPAEDAPTKAGIPGVILAYACAIPLIVFGIFYFEGVYDVASSLFMKILVPGGAFICPL